MTFYVVLLLFYANSHLISVVKVLFPPSSTPLSQYSWSTPEPLGIITSLGESQMKLAAKEFQEAYKELILEDDFSLSLYIKNNNLSISAAEAFKKEFIISTHIHIERNFSEDFLLSPELSCERIH